MIVTNSLLTLLTRRYIGTISLCNRIHTTSIQYHESHIIDDEHVRDRSVWFTTLPRKSLTSMIRSGKRKAKGKKPVFMPSGPLLISCKNKEHNYYGGMHYNKHTPIPLASRGWANKKSNGDYFTILAKSENTCIPEWTSNLDDEGKENYGAVPSGFKALEVNEELVERLKNAGFHHPTYVQMDAIPKLLAGKNLVITGETGCGKTLAYVVPIIDHIMRWKSKIRSDYNSPLALIVVPSRELAFQVGNVVSSIVEGSGITSKVLLADHTKKFLMNFDESDLENVDIVVSTLGIICKCTYHKVYNLNRCLHVVLDEADTLLDDSFSLKMQKLLGRCRIRTVPLELDDVPVNAQLTLVSATIPKQIQEKLDHILPVESLERITTKFLHQIPPHISQNFIRCKKSEKPQKLLDLVKKELENKRAIMLFSNKTETCNWLAHFLRENGVECARLNKRMELNERVKELADFREGRVNVITCTDIASRGQDIPRVHHVVNYEFPHYMADYVHRCGRTGRIGNDDRCEVTSFISRIRDVPLLNDIETSARTNNELPNVNNNIRRLLRIKRSKMKTI